MSVECYAYAFIGLEIPKDAIWQETFVPSCRHEKPSNAKFCPECGKTASMVKKRSHHPKYDEDKTTFCGFPFVAGTDGKRVFVSATTPTEGAKGSYSNECAEMQPLHENLEQRIAKLKKAMQEIGLWDESKFGIWAVNYCSY